MIIFHKDLSFENIKSHLVHLHQLAKIDNQIVREEKRYLYELGRKNGISEKLVDKIIRESEDHPFLLPVSKKERIIFVYEYIKMMLVDNKLDEREAKMCMLIAEKMGFKKALVGSITNSIVSAKDDDADPVLTDEELEIYISNPEI
ncbi:hypothetical protein JKA74_09115 [Marivirga sp. S37H4]|uniref:TerB family tellurite resistance protein n=1 Tax=Marivirga aurantiaca TaxID=2802615 RepID=A0A935C8V5_9BACT|nr:hypothetical protein [Marivirga aurantiaca]MBK6265197.1 hypothetical protein [Marivirga aurantiaca]